MKTAGSLDAILDDILIQIGEIVPYDSACLFLVDDGGLLAVAGRGLGDASTVIGKRFPLDDELTGRVLKGRQPVVLEDAGAHPVLEGWESAVDVRGWMGLPLVGQETTIGYLTLNSHQPSAFGTQEATFAQAFANQAAMTIEYARLYDEARPLLEQTLRQAEQLAQLMDIIPDGVLLLDQEHNIVQANGAAKAYLAQLADAQVGQKLTQLGAEPLESIIGASGANWHELRAIEPRGDFEVSAQPIDGSGKDGGWLLLIRNVTAERKQEGYLRAQERLSTIGQLAAGIAHDFNNIMAVISLYTQLVMRTSDLPDVGRQRLNIIQLQAQRASDLIRQILDFSRQSVVEKKPLDLVPFVRETVRALRQSLPESIQLDTRFNQDEYFIQADSGRLLQALNNIAANAADAMPGGGRLTFGLESLRIVSGGPVPLPDITPGEWICLTMADTGHGVPQEALSRVFEPFFSTKPPGHGTGLGLAQVYGIVKLHDGFINVDSHVGQGTTFTIYLPAFVPATQDSIQEDDDAIFTGAGEGILIVEDDPATREALAEYMSVLNYNVLTAANGQEALRLYYESAPQIQLVLTDIVMPVMDGATLYAKLKQAGADVRLIVITGYPLDASIVSMLEQEAVSFIQKPLRVREVARAVKEALSAGHD